MIKNISYEHKIWKEEAYIIEVNIDKKLWESRLVKNFEEDLSDILKSISINIEGAHSSNDFLISIMFSGDKEIMELNNKFRQINKPTNVLSFPSAKNSLPNSDTIFLGDIIFSIETIKSEAKSNKKTIIDHLTHLFIHGVLHLLGYDHETRGKALIMENLEICILSSLGIKNPYKSMN